MSPDKARVCLGVLVQPQLVTKNQAAALSIPPAAMGENQKKKVKLVG